MDKCGQCQSTINDLVYLRNTKKQFILCTKCFNRNGFGLMKGHGYLLINKIEFNK